MSQTHPLRVLLQFHRAGAHSRPSRHHPASAPCRSTSGVCVVDVATRRLLPQTRIPLIRWVRSQSLPKWVGTPTELLDDLMQPRWPRTMQVLHLAPLSRSTSRTAPFSLSNLFTALSRHRGETCSSRRVCHSCDPQVHLREAWYWHPFQGWSDTLHARYTHHCRCSAQCCRGSPFFQDPGPGLEI